MGPFVGGDDVNIDGGARGVRKGFFFSPSWRSGQGGALTQTQGCLSAWSAVILLAGLIVNIWLIRFLASGVTVSHSGEGNCEAQRKVIHGEATGKVAAMTLKHSIAYEMADNKKKSLWGWDIGFINIWIQHASDRHNANWWIIHDRNWKFMPYIEIRQTTCLV